MSWDTLAWSQADESSLGGAGAIADLVPMLRSALDEAASALVMGAVSVTGLAVATAAAADLPDGFASVTSFELLGTARRTAWVALEPAAGTTLAGATVSATDLAAALLEGLDGALSAIVGEGLGVAPVAQPALAPEGDILLLRCAVRDGSNVGVDLVVALDPAVPSELATHVVALQALGADAAPSPVHKLPSTPAMPAASAPSHVSAPAAHAATSVEPPAVMPTPAGTASVRTLALEEFGPSASSGASQNIELLMGVNLQVTVEIGRTRLAIRDVLALTPGSIVELDKLAGEKVDVLVNGHAIASGEVVVVDDNFGVRITDVVSRQRRIMSADSAA